ncbi:hypothetical protein PPERSA_07057 [Pseudocohnilembus persalinus]|uniref:Transmembrane protein n=1 Tax=Pseudocohnilembus persalinus TaxID=266149 RepID=A0A0V0QAQ5_PSEPJ|nr:hypothetical protein PPERSA_07057 [Pseudocohnilembus persalinus]|eukprot:KRW99285.1 hypothetical protein PPERSA_07057 [Pseudocohnilembus persalinus]
MKQSIFVLILVLSIFQFLYAQQEEEIINLDREKGISNSELADCFEQTLQQKCNLKYFQCLKDDVCKNSVQQTFNNCYILNSQMWYDPKCMQNEFKQNQKGQKNEFYTDFYQCLNDNCYVLEDQLISKKDYYTGLAKNIEDDQQKSLFIIQIKNQEETQEAFRKKPKSDDFSKKFACLYQILKYGEMQKILENCYQNQQCVQELEKIKDCLHYQEGCMVEDFSQKFSTKESKFIYNQVRDFCPLIFEKESKNQNTMKKIKDLTDKLDNDQNLSQEEIKQIQTQIEDLSEQLNNQIKENEEKAQEFRERVQSEL